jgi:hypothetical protein
MSWLLVGIALGLLLSRSVTTRQRFHDQQIADQACGLAHVLLPIRAHLAQPEDQTNLLVASAACAPWCASCGQEKDPSALALGSRLCQACARARYGRAAAVSSAFDAALPDGAILTSPDGAPGQRHLRPTWRRDSLLIWLLLVVAVAGWSWWQAGLRSDQGIPWSLLSIPPGLFAILGLTIRAWFCLQWQFRSDISWSRRPAHLTAQTPLRRD